MLGTQFGVCAVSVGFGSIVDGRRAERSSLPALLGSSCSVRFSVVRLGFGAGRCRGSKLVLVSCRSSRSDFGGGSGSRDDADRDYLEATLLVSETINHYHMRRRGFREDLTLRASDQLNPFSYYPKALKGRSNSLGQDFFHRFQSPTIFLKITCDGDFLLPITVGEFAIENLIEGQLGNEIGDTPDQFQFLSNIVQELGYEVIMVRITERVVNTYFSRLYFSKRGNNDLLSVDARPSDAINFASRCKIPVYVSKEIVLADALRIGYGFGRARNRKSTYDVSLDSATDGPDLLAEELDIVKKMKLAVQEERFKDAAMWRDKLLKLRKSK